MRFLHETQRGAPLDFQIPKWKTIGDTHYCTNKTHSEFGNSERQDCISEYRVVVYRAPECDWQSCYIHLADDIQQGVYSNGEHVLTSYYEVNEEDEAVLTVIVGVA